MDIPYPEGAQIIITHEAALPLAEQVPQRFAAALAKDAAAAARMAKQTGLPVGLALEIPAVPEWEEQDARPYTLRYMERCKQVLRPQLCEAAAFYYLRGEIEFPALRAAVISMSELTGRPLIVELAVHDDDANLEDGTDVCAAVGVLQAIGVTTILLSAPSPAALTEALDRVAPYARVSIGAKAHAAWLRADTTVYNTELFLTEEHDSEQGLLEALQHHHAAQRIEREHDDFILAPDGHEAHFIDPTIDISDEIECDHRLGEALIDAEDETGALKLVLESEEDVIALEEYRYMIARPICLCAESGELLEQGLRVYPGLALYDGTWEQPEELLQDLERKYGLIRL